MIRQSVRSVATTWLAGFLALLPLLLTATLLAWLVKLLNDYLGPRSLIGQLFGLVGQSFFDHPVLDWLAGWGLLLLSIYFFGILVQSKLLKPLAAFADSLVRKIPGVGSLYSLADRFVGLLDNKEDADIAAMSPVWCLFGGDGVAVLALLPNPQPLDVEGRDYLAILVPTAPVPIGGGLLYVPKEWIRPAHIGVDKLTSVYMSMGITPPPALKKALAKQDVA